MTLEFEKVLFIKYMGKVQQVASRNLSCELTAWADKARTYMRREIDGKLNFHTKFILNAPKCIYM
jgi:hypothetical protein